MSDARCPAGADQRGRVGLVEMPGWFTTHDLYSNREASGLAGFHLHGGCQIHLFHHFVYKSVLQLNIFYFVLCSKSLGSNIDGPLIVPKQAKITSCHFRAVRKPAFCKLAFCTRLGAISIESSLWITRKVTLGIWNSSVMSIQD